mgnify:FL=1
MIHAICDFCGKDCDRTATLLSMTPFQNFARYHTDNEPYGNREKTRSFVICYECCKNIKADHIAWSYADGPIYEGDSFHSEDISAKLIYADNTQKELAVSDFELTKTPEILTADDHTVAAKTILGEEQYEIPLNTISKLSMESKDMPYLFVKSSVALNLS